MKENPKSRKVKGSYILIISCGYCKTDLARYQKKGKGNVLRMHIDRIVEASIDYGKELRCPNCGKSLGSKVKLKKSESEFYKIKRGTINTRKLDI